ncbi:putative secreted protein [Wickerhamomyces ciferrii]|uniref:Secreted protein n=1 Tax=Wickerhamomyces ciferrii (strain ATCC 14091 / BCRC 22168 / CBS 111 / JCM 3599 / NBRC 0793 / NRRL Y-1031 F-60-10) TaxID=1206466 RepID=K0KUW5_WICCF|nr:uncharacterized protein BN7_6635 [Wickerhamomyces ciferrii]CCH47026.1 putative secreted protein [Wickerhamomyces ciferrii]
MKFTSVIAPGLLLSVIAASPIFAPAATESSIDSNGTTFQSDNSTDVSLQGEKFCFKKKQKDICHGGTFKKCVKYYRGMPPDGERIGPNTCGFWCTTMKKTEDCGFNKLKYNYHPDFACADADFSC